ncbi:c-type cytochrome domain-containing protein [Tundrisphaera lichenicola]|uniref:c-type cytochrome domain-containing protein n=1 Tax=Tundrisphaera lichenicola TaxID=2029860 RepID=UPI003EB9AAE4
MDRRWKIVLGAMVWAVGTAQAEEIPFLGRVAPIVVERCLSCHNPKKAMGNYRVDTWARMMADSRAGPMIEPGRPDDSLFLMLIESNEPNGRMPKGKKPLPAAEIAILRRWIEEGARGEGIDPDSELAGLVARAKAARPR